MGTIATIFVLKYIIPADEMADLFMKLVADITSLKETFINQNIL